MYTNQFYIDQYNRNAQRAEELLSNTSHELINTVPSPGKWCIGEIIDHLIISGSSYLDVMEKRLEGDTDSLPKGGGPYTHPWSIRFMTKAVSPESERKLPTVPPFVPHDHKNFRAEELVAGLKHINERFIGIVIQAEEKQLHLGKIKAPNPVFPIWKMSLSGCLAVNEAHQRRHLLQVERIIETAG